MLLKKEEKLTIKLASLSYGTPKNYLLSRKD